jgi:hypothetical protein
MNDKEVQRQTVLAAPMGHGRYNKVAAAHATTASFQQFVHFSRRCSFPEQRREIRTNYWKDAARGPLPLLIAGVGLTLTQSNLGQTWVKPSQTWSKPVKASQTIMKKNLLDSASILTPSRNEFDRNHH